MSPEMIRRWKGWRSGFELGNGLKATTMHTATSGQAPDSDHRPTGRVFITRGMMRHHYFRETPEDLEVDLRRAVQETRFRGDWDEKYTWYGQPGEGISVTTDTGETVLGGLMPEETVGPIEMPFIKSINISNNLGQNGMGNATIVMGNYQWEEHEDPFTELLYHTIRTGFFSPFYGGDDFGLAAEDHEADLLLGFDEEDMIYDENGKRITGLLLPNRKIEVYQGYGDEIQRTFVGYIDTVEITMENPQITLKCSDTGRPLTEFTFMKTPDMDLPYPVSFGDYEYWSLLRRSQWPDRTMILVRDLTDIAGHILGWGGFQYFRAPRVGRIGGTGLASEEGIASHDAVFNGDRFEKGVHFIDGLNIIKELLGWTFFVTPDFWNKGGTGASTDPNYSEGNSAYQSARYSDPTVYDEEYSRFTIGVPNLVPLNVWNRAPEAEQFFDNELITAGSLTYDISALRKNMYVVNSGLIGEDGRDRTIGMTGPWDLHRGIQKHIVYDVSESMGQGVKLNEQEIKRFISMMLMQTVVQFAKGSIQVPGYPGAKINDQCDVLDSATGTWRRFFITGFESNMTLGQNSSYATRLTVVNIDNQYIRRLLNRIISAGGSQLINGLLTNIGNIRYTAEPA